MNILTANFTILANCPMQSYFSCQLILNAQKESQHSFTNEEVYKLLIDRTRSGQDVQRSAVSVHSDFEPNIVLSVPPTLSQ